MRYLKAKNNNDQGEIMAKKVSTESKIRNIRRKTRCQYTAEEKIRLLLEGLQRGAHY